MRFILITLCMYAESKLSLYSPTWPPDCLLSQLMCCADGDLHGLLLDIRLSDLWSIMTDGGFWLVVPVFSLLDFCQQQHINLPYSQAFINAISIVWYHWGKAIRDNKILELTLMELSQMSSRGKADVLSFSMSALFLDAMWSVFLNLESIFELTLAICAFHLDSWRGSVILT